MKIERFFEHSMPAMPRFFVKMMMTNLVSKTMEHENVQKLLNDTSAHFDVVIVEWMFSSLSAG